MHGILQHSPRQHFCCFFLQHFLQYPHAVAYYNPHSAALHCGCKELLHHKKVKSHFAPTTATVQPFPEKNNPKQLNDLHLGFVMVLVSVVLNFPPFFFVTLIFKELKKILDFFWNPLFFKLENIFRFYFTSIYLM